MDNNFILGNCMEQMPLIAAKSVDLVLTDIPYAEVNRKSNGLRNLNKGAADILTFDIDLFLEELNRICKGSIYIFCGTEQVSQIRAKLVKLGLSTRHCIWKKTNPSPMNGQSIWLSSIENCIFAKNKGVTFNQHCKGSVWEFPCGRNKLHPTEKNHKLLQYLIESSSNVSDLVFDPCAGSGSTLLNAKKLDRRYLGIELNQEYYNIALNRLNAEPNSN